MRQEFKLNVIAPVGPILIGGYSPSVKGVGAAGATSKDGHLMIPSTAIRGALRESLERILRGMKEGVCDGGRGDKIGERLADDDEASDRKFVGCTLGPDGQRCVVCQIFGTASTQGGPQATEGVLIMSDLLGPEPFPSIIRHNVAVDRRTRGAGDGLLRTVTTQHKPGVEYQGDVIFRGGETQLKYLRAAVKGTTHLGQGRSRGFGRVDVVLGIGVDLGGTSSPVPRSLPVTGDLKIRFKLKSPTLIGETLPGHAFLDTRFELPGSAVRGMLGFAIADSEDNPNDNQEFQTLVAAGDSGAIFDFFRPIQTKRPCPTTFRQCKSHKTEVWDTLFDRLRLLKSLPIEDWRCSKCKGLLKRVKGGDLKTQTVTRTSLDRRHGGVRDNALFSQRLLSPGNVFEGSIRRIPTGGHALIEQGLAQPLTIGRGAARGWGRIEVVECETLPSLPSIENRAQAYANHPAGFFTDSKTLLVTLLSPALFEDEGKLLTQIGEYDEENTLRARRFGLERGWSKDPRKGRKRGCLDSIRSVLAGGVYVLKLKEQLDFKHLAGLEVDGIGERTYQGFGRVRFFDPIHLQTPQTGEVS